MPTLNQEQITGLNAANERVTKGLGSAEEIARDQQNINFASKTYGWKPQTFNATAPSGSDLASTVAGYQGPGATTRKDTSLTPFQQGTGIEGYDAALAAESAAAKPKETDWMADWMKQAFGQPSLADQVKAPTFEAEKARLQAARDSRITALDAQYATDLATVQKNNKNLGNSLKSRLMKLGISPSDSAWSNAEAGQLERDTASEAKLRSEYMSNKAKIESDSDEALTNITMNEARMSFDATVKNIETKLQTQAQGINLYQIFSNRDQSEKDREQKAYGDLLQYQGTMAALDQKQQEAIAKTFIDNARSGLYNISDKATLELLAKLEKESPYLSGLTGVASAGLSDRLDKKAQDAATLAKTNIETEKLKSDIQENLAQIAKLRAGVSGSSAASKEEKALYADMASQLNLLATGKTDWATAYNTIKTKHPAGSVEQGRAQDTLIDNLMNSKKWSQPGAYENQVKERGTGGDNLTIINAGSDGSSGG